MKPLFLEEKRENQGNWGELDIDVYSGQAKMSTSKHRLQQFIDYAIFQENENYTTFSLIKILSFWQNKQMLLYLNQTLIFL